MGLLLSELSFEITYRVFYQKVAIHFNLSKQEQKAVLIIYIVT